MKKSILMLTALFMLGACSTAGNDDTSGGSTPSTESTFLGLVGGKSNYDTPSAGEYKFSSDGKTLTIYVDGSESNDKNYTFAGVTFENKVYTAAYLNGDKDKFVQVTYDTEKSDTEAINVPDEADVPSV